MPNTGYKKLGWKTFWVFLSDKSKPAILVGVISWALLAFKVPYAGWSVLVFFLVAIGTAIVVWFDYSGYGYELGEDALRVKHGVFHKDETAIPYRQIQNVDIERPFLYVLSGTSRLVILTAGQEDKSGASADADSEGVIPIIDKDLAVELQNELLKKANIQKVVQV